MVCFNSMGVTLKISCGRNSRVVFLIALVVAAGAAFFAALGLDDGAGLRKKLIAIPITTTMAIIINRRRGRRICIDLLSIRKRQWSSMQAACDQI